MIYYLAFVSALNLALGYVLGVYLGVLPGWHRSALASAAPAPPAKRRIPTAAPEAELIDVSVADVAGAIAEDSTPAEPLAGVDLPLVDEIPETTVAADEVALDAKELRTDTQPADSEAEVQASPIEDEPPTADQDATPPPPTPTTPEIPAASEAVNLEEFVSSLASFQAELMEVDHQLQENDEAATALEACATQFKQASKSFLGQANDAFQHLEPAAEDSTSVVEEKRNLKEAIMDQAKRVKHQSQEFDALNTPENADVAKESLQHTSLDLSDAAEQLQNRLASIFANAPTEAAPDQQPAQQSEPPGQSSGAPPTDDPGEEPAVDLTPREIAEREIDAFCAREAADEWLQVGVVAVDRGEELTNNYGSRVCDRLLTGIAKLVGDVAPRGHTIAPYDQHMLLWVFAGDTQETATQLLEQVRQQIEAIQFAVDGGELYVTVSCGLAAVGKAVDRTTLMTHFDEALSEARRFGSNRSFRHDGTTPEPIVPPSVSVQPQSIAI